LREIAVDLGKKTYPIYIGIGILDTIGTLFCHHKISKKLVLITDETVKNLYAEKVIKILEDSNFLITEIVVPVGENSKSLEIVDSVFERIINARIDRESSIVALGGGVIGDLSGFIAATYMRGISYVQIPTTLLAQTDSSVGGKVGINHRLGKNLIGAFYQPKFVIIDAEVLKTLDQRDLISGLGEVIKYGLIGDKNFFKKVSDNFDDLLNKSNLSLYEEIIDHCCRIKAKIVAEDEKESGLRKILNFGHTIGHALEAATNYEYYRHGEAVILGMIAINWLSYELNLLSQNEFNQINAFFDMFPNLNIPAEIFLKDILEKTYFDKKFTNNKICLILLKEIGETIILENFEERNLMYAINYLLKERQQ